jgi:hypothetical protein
LKNRRQSTSRLSLLPLLLLLDVSLLAAPELPAEVGLEAPEYIRRLAAVEEPIALESFIRAALLFSDTPESELPAFELKLESLVGKMRDRLAPGAGSRQQAEGALAFMHEEILNRYDEKQTRLDLLIEGGQFNCVSSGVLYAILVKALGQKVWGVRTADHAFCRVDTGEGVFDVETTSPFGFDPGKRQQFTDNFGRVTGYTYVPPSNYRDRRDIGERELLALILFNRTAFLSELRSYAQAVSPAVDAYALLGNGESYDRMITAVHNLASWYGMSGRFEQALSVLSAAARAYPDGRLESLRGDLIHNWVLSLVQRGALEEAEALVDSRLREGELDPGQWRSLTVYIYQLKAQAAGRGDFARAAGIIAEGLKKVGPDQGLMKSYEAYVHNAVVTLVRAERLQEALGVLEEALSRAPESTVLRDDQSKILEQLGG